MNFTFYITYIYSFFTLMFHTPLNIKRKTERPERREDEIVFQSLRKQRSHKIKAIRHSAGAAASSTNRLAKAQMFSTDSRFEIRGEREGGTGPFLRIISFVFSHWRRITH